MGSVGGRVKGSRHTAGILYDKVFSPSLQTFRSLIVTPHMTTSDVLLVALAQIAPTESSADFQLIEKTPKGGRPHSTFAGCVDAHHTQSTQHLLPCVLC